MTILEHISQMKLDADGGALVGWTDVGAVERGCGYVERVKEIASAYNLLAGVVDGTTRYYTNVRIEVNGFLDAICSCPVGRHRQMPSPIGKRLWVQGDEDCVQ